MKNRTTQNTPYQWFSAFLDNLSTIINSHASVDKDNADKRKMNQLIKRSKRKLKSQMRWEEISQLEDEIFSMLLNMLPDYLDVTGLFNKIQYEVKRKEAITKNINENKNINKVMISQRIQDYIDKNAQRISDIFSYLKHKEQNQYQERDESIILTISLAYHKRGIAYSKLGEADKAILDLNQAILLDPTNGAFYQSRAKAYAILQTEWVGIYRSQIFQDYTKAIELDPTDIIAYYHRAKSYSSLSKQTIALFTQLIEFNPKAAIEHSYRGLVLSELGNFHEAIDEHDKAIALDPNAAILYLNRAITFQKCQFIPMLDILIDCCMAFHMDPQDFAIQCDINDLFQSLFENQTPEKVFKDVISTIKNEKLQIILLKDALDKKTLFGKWIDRRLFFPDKFFLFPNGLLNQMKNYYNELIKKHVDLKNGIGNDSDQIKSVISQYYLDKENNKKTKSAAEKAEDYLRRSFVLFNRHNPWKYESGDYQAVIEACTRAIALSPKNERAYYNRGIVYQEWSPLQNHYLAITDFTQVINLVPDHAIAYFRLGHSFARICINEHFQPRKNFEEAITAYTSAIALEPVFTDAYLARASLYEKIARIDLAARKSWMAKAIADCMMVSQIKPDDTHNQKMIIGLLKLGLKQIEKDDKEDVLDVIKEISDAELQIKVLNYLLFENVFSVKSLRPILFTAEDIVRMKAYRNQLVVERNNERNAALALAQAHRQNLQAKELARTERYLIDESKENRFFPLATETIKHIGFFSSKGSFHLFDNYFNEHSSSKGATHQNEAQDQPSTTMVKRGH